MTHAADIVGYTYQAANYCTDCITDALLDEQQQLFFDCRHDTVSGTLDAVAHYRGIDIEDEHTFDSDDFPKVIFADQIEEDETCATCGEVL